MDPAVTGALISAGSNLLGGFFGKSNADKQVKLQKKFAKNAIQWKVNDAKKAGIHPLYALGAQTTSYQPVSVGGGFETALPNMGQDINRALNAGISESGRQNVMTKTMQNLQLEGMKLDNDIKRAQIASTMATVNQPGSPPGLPSYLERWLMPGQGNGPSISHRGIMEQTRRDVSEPGAPWSVAGAGPSTGFVLNNMGGYSPVIPPELAESYEQDWLGSIDWQMRNRLAPNFGVGAAPAIPHAENEEVYFDRRTQDWRIRPKGRRYRMGIGPYRFEWSY